MGNHFGEIRVDVKYIDNVAEILNSLKNCILEEEKVGREPFPFKDDSSSAGDSSSKGQSSSHQSEKMLGNYSDLKTQPKNNASPWAALAGGGSTAQSGANNRLRFYSDNTGILPSNRLQEKFTRVKND